MSSNREQTDNRLVSVREVERSSNSEEIPIASQPRPPRNLQDLLRYSTEAANLPGHESNENCLQTLSEEDRKFLENALKSMTLDIVEELLKHIKILQSANLIEGSVDSTKFEDALDSILDYVDNIDVANDFHKIGGFCIFKPCLQSIHSSIRWRGAELIAQLCQNNPYCQNKVLESKLVPTLLQMIDSDIDDLVRVKALYAISCLARGSEEGLKEFIITDGFSVLLRALQTDVQKLNIKSAFLLTSICQWKPHVKDDLVNMGYVEQLISQIAVFLQKYEEGHPPSLEHLLNALLAIVEDNSMAQEISRTPELRFKSLLDFIIKNSENKEEFNEENEYASKLSSIIFGECENTDEDR
ncbi:Hsp70-binding protein, putative [Pediculus humanus corporis]|uniref:Hsp70-binding protein, putative n=1 Tax=Pediculus humanus subsp. corporis TaxID=121224 RepID=E0VPZ3_PEDHC|nr:Hsp70-binding protein, putative [Pediculus humanus corporis]EEB15449.1 Hsp70-binding protein, putative [Pediculus humanus corporis]